MKKKTLRQKARTCSTYAFTVDRSVSKAKERREALLYEEVANNIRINMILWGSNDIFGTLEEEELYYARLFDIYYGEIS